MATISRYIVSYDIALYGIWYHDTSAIYHAISHRITPKYQANIISTKTHHLVGVYSCSFRLCLCPHLGLSSVWPLSSFCCPSAGHIIGLTVPPANSNLVHSGLGLLPERMFFFFFFPHFSCFFFSLFPCLFSFVIPGTWCSLRNSYEVPDILLLLT